MTDVSGQQYIGGRPWIIYQVLTILGQWHTIDPALPVMDQAYGIRGYRLLSSDGTVIKSDY